MNVEGMEKLVEYIIQSIVIKNNICILSHKQAEPGEDNTSSNNKAWLSVLYSLFTSISTVIYDNRMNDNNSDGLTSIRYATVDLLKNNTGNSTNDTNKSLSINQLGELQYSNPVNWQDYVALLLLSNLDYIEHEIINNYHEILVCSEKNFPIGKLQLKLDKSLGGANSMFLTASASDTDKIANLHSSISFGSVLLYSVITVVGIGAFLGGLSGYGGR